MSSSQNRNVVATSAPRLLLPDDVAATFDMKPDVWRVLTDAIFPSAKSPHSISLALSYCRSRNLDIMKRPVHIVPMWDSKQGRYVETVWPSIGELRTTAARTGEYGGCDAAEFGPVITSQFSGRVKKRDRSGNESYVNDTVDVSYPEWCRLTVYRIVKGQKCAFVGPKVLWKEAYATIGNTDLPNDMWMSRSEGQLEKCAEAAALRRAFPEELGNEYAAEEMSGRRIDEIKDAEIVDTRRDESPPRPQGTHSNQASGAPQPEGPQGSSASVSEPVIWDETEERPKEKPHQIATAGLSINKWVEKYIAAVESSDTVQEVYLWIDKNQSVLNEVDTKAKALYATIKQATERTLADLRKGNAAAPAAPAKEPHEVASTPAGDAEKKDAKPPRQRKGKASTPDNLGALPEPPDQNPETILKWCDATLAAITDPDYLEEVWSSRCAPLMTGMFPPDQEEMQAMYARHEKRLGGD